MESVRARRDAASVLRARASAEIRRRLRDPAFRPEDLRASLEVSRSVLYLAFGEVGGVAGAIRDARLDRVRRYLSDPRSDKLSITEIAGRCGFTDLPTFSHAFRRRFGLAPREWRARRGGP